MATTAIDAITSTVEVLESTPSPAMAATNGTFSSCHRTRTRAGASKATKPLIRIAVPSALASPSSHQRASRSAIPTGVATSSPRRNAGHGSPRRPQSPGRREAIAAAVRAAPPPRLRGAGRAAA